MTEADHEHGGDAGSREADGAATADPVAPTVHGCEVGRRDVDRVQTLPDQFAEVAHARSPFEAAAAARRRLARAAEAWDLTVPRLQPRTSAICSSERSS